MGRDIDRDHFDAADHRRFAERLERGLEALALLLARPGFGTGPPSLGAELEVSLVDARGRPLPINRAVLARALDPQVTLEVDRFNLEINTPPLPLAGRPFAALATEFEDALGAIRRAAGELGGRVVMVGILPTLTRRDLASGALTDSRRYHALSAGLRALRQEPFRVRIDGEDRLAFTADDVTLQGANTSLQLHLKVAPADFARTYNAAQIATAPALAAATNSPIFLGRRLWEETRIALVRQSVDDRPGAGVDDWRPARVSFGHGWVRGSPLELFAESVKLHVPLLPVVGTEDPLDCARRGDVPGLDELRLHHGTVWHWNRAVYDAVGGGHVRVEMRALPSGPTVADMMANTAFLLGLVLGLAPDLDTFLQGMTFGHARRNFYLAARLGLDAELLWPSEARPSPRPMRAADLIPTLLPVARRGLVGAGVDPLEVDPLLALLRARVERGVTGARWQRRTVNRLEDRRPSPQATAAMLERYLAAQATGRPVHEWPLDPV